MSERKRFKIDGKVLIIFPFTSHPWRSNLSSCDFIHFEWFIFPFVIQFHLSSIAFLISAVRSTVSIHRRPSSIADKDFSFHVWIFLRLFFCSLIYSALMNRFSFIQHWSAGRQKEKFVKTWKGTLHNFLCPSIPKSTHSNKKTFKELSNCVLRSCKSSKFFFSLDFFCLAVVNLFSFLTHPQELNT